jgi:hypothetical protein
MRQLRLESLFKQMPPLTRACTQIRGEAGAVCLDSQDHGANCRLSVSGAFTEEFHLTRPDVTDAMRRSHNDMEKATEHGAEGVSFLLVLKLTPYRIIEQSRKGTRIDWWLGHKGRLLQNAARLEVSGIRDGTSQQLQARADEKVTRAKRAKSTLPTYVCVTNFRSPCAKVVQL